MEHTDTDPRLQPVDALVGTCIRHRDPVLLLTEARDHLSVVFARAVEVDDVERRLCLADCRWLLFGRLYVGDLPVEQVTVGHGPTGHWEAVDPGSGALIRWPSDVPYLVAFLPQWMARVLRKDLDALRMLAVLDRIVRVFGSAPGFWTSRSGELLSRPDYAGVHESEVDTERLMTIPDEFRLD